MLSNTSKYAIRALIYLALYATKTKKIGIKTISEELGIPTPFLGKILQMLARQKILDSTKGPHGGFYLKKPAMDISLMEIVEIIDGVDVFNQCIIRTEPCNPKEPCSLHHMVSPYQKGIQSIMLTESLADLASEFRNNKDKFRI